MDVLIKLETETIITDANRNEIIAVLPREAPNDNPIFVNNQFENLSRVYVNDEIFKTNEKEILEKLAQYIRGLQEIDTISIAAELFKEPVISTIQEIKKRGLTVDGNYTLTKEDYEKLKNTEVINVVNCDESLLMEGNVYLTRPVGYQSNEIFSTEDQISLTQRENCVKINKPLTPETKHDLELFFKWNRKLETIELSDMSPVEYLEIIEFLKPYLNKIPEIKLETNIKNNSVEEMKRIIELLGDQSEKVTVEYGTHLNQVELIRNKCSLEEYMTMDQILTSYKNAIEVNDYSPLEKLIYAYDITKNANYQELEEDKLKSRKLHSVVLGEKIVCVGYSNLLNGLLTKLGIPATYYSTSLYRSPEAADEHQRSIIYLQDPKYGINGLFTCDPTWDARSTTDLGYDRPIDRYNFFLLPYDQMKYSIVPESMNAISALFVKQGFVEKMQSYFIYQKELIKINKELGMISTDGVVDEESEEFQSMVNSEKETIKRNKIYNFIRGQISNFRQEIPFETIASAIETVRRTEGVYSSEAELREAMIKIIELHDQFRPMAFNDDEKTLFVEMDGKFQVLVTPVEKKVTQEKTV